MNFNLPTVYTRQNARNDMRALTNYGRSMSRKAAREDWNLFGTIMRAYYSIIFLLFGRHRSKAFTSAYAVARAFLLAIAGIVLFIQVTINVPFLKKACEGISNNYTPVFYRYLPFAANTEMFIAKFALVGMIVLVAIVGVVTFDSLAANFFSLSQWRKNTMRTLAILFWFVAINVVVEGYTITNLGNKKGEDVWAQSSAEDKRRAAKVEALQASIEDLESQKKEAKKAIQTLSNDLSGETGIRARVGWYKAGTPAYKDAVSTRDRMQAQINQEKDALQYLTDQQGKVQAKIDELESITEQAAQTAEMIGQMEGFGLGALLFLCLVSFRAIKPNSAPTLPEPPQVHTAQAPELAQPAQRTEPEPNRVQTNEPNPNRTRTREAEQPRTRQQRRVSAREIIANNEGVHNLFMSVAQNGNTDHTQYVTLEAMHKDIGEKLRLNWQTVKRIYNQYYSGRF